MIVWQFHGPPPPPPLKHADSFCGPLSNTWKHFVALRLCVHAIILIHIFGVRYPSKMLQLLHVFRYISHLPLFQPATPPPAIIVNTSLDYHARHSHPTLGMPVSMINAWLKYPSWWVAFIYNSTNQVYNVHNILASTFKTRLYWCVRFALLYC